MTKKIIWLWKLFWGKKYFITSVKEGLAEDEILVYGHRIYILERAKKDE